MSPTSNFDDIYFEQESGFMEISALSVPPPEGFLCWEEGNNRRFLSFLKGFPSLDVVYQTSS